MKAINRAADLDAYLQEQEARTFDWGDFNCCHFAQGWVQREEGLEKNLVPKVRGRKGVLRAIHNLGGLEVAISRALARESIPAALARQGDIVLFRNVESMMLGICCGRTAACLGEGKGNIVHLEMKNASVAWAVGVKV